MMNTMRNIKLISLWFTVLFVSFFIVSCETAKPIVNAGADGIAIKGYDPVAYFTMGKPVKGSDDFTHEWKGARWLFSSREHIDLFKANPDKYAPQYGGY
jgi:YHS domain-containing protein